MIANSTCFLILYSSAGFLKATVLFFFGGGGEKLIYSPENNYYADCRDGWMDHI